MSTREWLRLSSIISLGLSLALLAFALLFDTSVEAGDGRVSNIARLQMQLIVVIGSAVWWMTGVVLLVASAIIDKLGPAVVSGVGEPAPTETVQIPAATVAAPAVEQPADPEEEARRARSNEIAIVLFLAFLVVLGSFLVFAVPRGRTKPPEVPAATNSVGDTVVPSATDAMVANLSGVPGAE